MNVSITFLKPSCQQTSYWNESYFTEENIFATRMDTLRRESLQSPAETLKPRPRRNETNPYKKRSSSELASQLIGLSFGDQLRSKSHRCEDKRIHIDKNDTDSPFTHGIPALDTDHKKVACVSTLFGQQTIMTQNRVPQNSITQIVDGTHEGNLTIGQQYLWVKNDRYYALV